MFNTFTFAQSLLYKLVSVNSNLNNTICYIKGTPKRVLKAQCIIYNLNFLHLVKFLIHLEN